MSRLMNQDRGSKRRLRRVRWTRGEKVTALLLFLVLAMETIIVTLFLIGHPFD